jgi:hypothetical protein
MMMLVLALAFAAPPKPPKPAKTPLLLSAGQIVDSLFPRFSAQKESPRVTIGKGLLGIGSYQKPTMDPDGAVPLYVMPRVGLGQSLNVNPVTGRVD